MTRLDRNPGPAARRSTSPGRGILGLAAACALLAAPTVARAHRPHAVVYGMAASNDFASGGRIWAVMDPAAVSQLMVSSDFGAHWDFAGGAPQQDELVSITYAQSTLIALSKDGSVWWTHDEGDAWNEVQLPDGASGRAVAAAGAWVVFATSTGLYLATTDDMTAITRVYTQYRSVSSKIN